MSLRKIPCKYGSSCYRRNLLHFEEFDHPPELLARLNESDSQTLRTPSATSSASSKDNQNTNVNFPSDFPIKKMKAENNLSPCTGAFIGDNPTRFGYYLTKVNGIDRKYNTLVNENSVASVGIEDILSEKSGQLVESAQFSYMFEVDWIVEQYPKSWRKCPLHLVHGVKINERSELAEECKAFPQVVPCPVKITDPYGTHHTKMMILHFEHGLRIVIHTANMISGDWSQKTQGVWISPIFPILSTSSVEHCQTNFKDDLVEYLKSYESSQMNKWIALIERHDFSSAKVVLVASVPGRHKDSKRSKFGHLKFRKMLNEKFGPSRHCAEWPVVCQFSSIGSLGPQPEKWLTGQFLSSLGKTASEEFTLAKPQLKCIFPTVDNVRTSLEGYLAGANLPYSSKVAQRQLYLAKFCHQWKATSTGRSDASPHIKTYCRLSPDKEEIAWFLLTSANLSKAAWGELQCNGSQLAIRSFELGVLFLPQVLCGADHFKIKEHHSKCSNFFPLPYDTPLTPYSSKDQPWMYDKVYPEKDRFGRDWGIF